MNKPSHKRISKLMSLALRHDPSALGLELNASGWAEVEAVLRGLNDKGLQVDRELLEAVVRENDKQRFGFSEDGKMIRANQGHSIEVDLDLHEAAPPDILYHGTVARFLEDIRREGLKKMSRHHVHLSAGRSTATAVGGRRGKPVILIVRAAEMAAEGHVFYLSENEVWLTEHVPAHFLDIPFSRSEEANSDN